MMTFRETSDAVEGSSVASVSMTSAGEREANTVVDEEAEEVVSDHLGEQDLDFGLHL